MLISLLEAANPLGLPTIENIFMLFASASLNAFIRLTLTFFSTFPSPTEKIRIASLAHTCETFKYSEKLYQSPHH